MALFGNGSRDRTELVRTLEALGPTSVDRLSQALAWPPRRTVRTLESLARSSAAVEYDASTGAVRPAVAPDPRGTPAPAPAPEAPAPPEAGDRLRGGPCPSCHKPLKEAGTPGTFYCAECGTIETRAVNAPSPVPARSPPSTGVHRAGGLDDRQAQELFAAWVTAQPIHCPRCRQTLTHRGVQSYTCPACGEEVQFADTGVRASAPNGN